MAFNESKYTFMPDNSYFDRRMANGEKLSDIFDSVDWRSRSYSEDTKRPVTVRIGKKYNYVANNFILFDNWFVLAEDFGEYEDYTFAYRRFDENGIREGGVLIKRNGTYVSREEFLDIVYGSHIGCGKYAIVKQYNGLLNIIDVTKGVKAEKIGIKADGITYASQNFIDSGIFIIATGNIKRINDLDWTGVGECNIAETVKTKKLKCNLYSINGGILSPAIWFDYIQSFQNIGYKMYPHTKVHLEGKVNLINQQGRLLSDIWFDEIGLNSEGEGEAVILKSPNLKDLPDLDDRFYYNPNKYKIYKIDKMGRIKL